MTKEIEVENGQGLLQIESDGFSECIKINDRIASIIWRTHHHYYAVSKEQSGLEFLKMDFPELDANHGENAIFPEVEKLLNIFSNGKYKIKIQAPTRRQYAIGNDNLGFNKSLDGDSGHFTFCTQTEHDLIAFTRPSKEMDQEIIEGYKYQILIERKKPLVLIFNAWQFGEDAFVIDGHHKLLAYHDLAIAPNFLKITKTKPKVELNDNLIAEYKTVMNTAEFNHYNSVVSGKE